MAAFFPICFVLSRSIYSTRLISQFVFFLFRLTFVEKMPSTYDIHWLKMFSCFIYLCCLNLLQKCIRSLDFLFFSVVSHLRKIELYSVFILIKIRENFIVLLLSLDQMESWSPGTSHSRQASLTKRIQISKSVAYHGNLLCFGSVCICSGLFGNQRIYNINEIAVLVLCIFSAN